jgi:hypothetical protein
MPTHDEALLEAAAHLLERPEGQRGRLSGARVRRGVSTVYYALFHFLLDEIGQKIHWGSRRLACAKCGGRACRSFSTAGPVQSSIPPGRGRSVRDTTLGGSRRLIAVDANIFVYAIGVEQKPHASGGAGH